MRKLILLVIFLFWVSSACATVEIEGVTFKTQRQLVDAELQLTGTALLTWAMFFDVYVGAFYLPPGQPGSRWNEDVPKQLEISYLRNFKAEDFSTSSDKLLRENLSSEEYQALAARLNTFYKLFHDISPGDRYSLVYHPDIGTQLRLNNMPLGSVAGHDFAVAYFGLWIGPNPISERFRDKLLGG
ncbi:MAG: chalcone isomerase family protein [Geobacteraceae bacterium]|nr:chalcone isomerase family protein [Geobacteraceae bacterium]